jgi:hypothetical protein
MRTLNPTILFTSLLALGCGADIGTTDGHMTDPDATSTGPGGTPVTPVPNGSQPATGGSNTTNPTPSSTPTNVNPPPNSNQCTPGVPATSQLPRLTNAQYERTVYDLLGVEATGLLAAEQEGVINRTVWDGYTISAEYIADQVMSDPTLKARFMKCTLVADGTDCLRQTIVDFGKRAYRRPLTDDELASFDERILARRAEITPNDTPDEVAKRILTTFLQSPGFLLRGELGEDTDAEGNFVLTDYEVASRLSYLIWGSMPDDALFAAADAGELRTKQQVLAQAERMVADDKARFVAREFHDKYVHLTDSQHADRWYATTKDTGLFPKFLPEITSDMIVETQMFFDDVFTSGGTFQDLFLTTTGFVTARTAPIYGVEGNFSAIHTKTQLGDSRRGFLTRVGFLAAFSNQERTNPILRGSFITKEVLGVNPGSPNAAAANTPLPTDPDLDTLRKRVDAMTAAPGCKECHQPFINPPGFVLESYDAAGEERTLDKTIVASGVALDTETRIKVAFDAEPVPVSNAQALMMLIADAPSAQRHYAAKWVGYAFDRVPKGPDLCTVDALSAKIAAGNYSIRNLITDLTQQDYFMTRAVEVTQ